MRAQIAILAAVVLCVAAAAALLIPRLTAPSPAGAAADGAPVAPAAGAARTDWPIFRGDPPLDGVAAGQIPDRPALLWRFRTGQAVESSPVVVGKKVFVGCDDGNVYALDLGTGAKLWARKTGGAVEAPPMVHRGVVYVGSSDEKLYALNAADGSVRWTYKTGAKLLGSANWAAGTPAPTTRPSGSTPAGERAAGDGGDRILVGSYDNRLHCLSLSGQKLWTYKTDNYINGSPAVWKHLAVFGGCDANVHAVSTADGSAVQVVDTGAYIAGSAAVVGGKAFVGNYGGEVLCVDLETGAVVWRYGDKENPFFSSPAVEGGRVVIGGRDKRLHCLRATDGQRLWTFQARDNVDSSPAIVGGKVVFGCDDGRLYVVALADGRELWSYTIGEAIPGSPAVAGGRIIVGADDGVVYCFGPKR